MNLDKDLEYQNCKKAKRNKFKSEALNTLTAKLKSESAVTLTALVITIIVMIVLAAVSVLAVFGENGIFKSAITAKEDTETAAYEEELKAIEVQTKTQQMKSNVDSFAYLAAFENNVKNNSMFNGSDTEIKNNNTVLKIQTKEKYIFYITDDGESQGIISGIDQEVDDPDDLYLGGNEGDGEGGNQGGNTGDGENPGENVPEGATKVTFTCDPSTLTNKNVEVTVSISPDPTQQIQYRKNNSGKWEKINNNSSVTMTECGTLNIRLFNGYTGGKVVSKTIDWIDKVAPRTPVVSCSATEEQIEVTASAIDVAQTSKTACSDNVTYRYKISGNGITNTNWTEYTPNSTYIFGKDYGIVENGVYTITVQAKDGVGNPTEEVTVDASTTRIPDAQGNIEITADGGTSEANWTKGPVTVTIRNKGAVTGYDLAYSLDGTNYELVPSNGKITGITTNNTTVHAVFQNKGKAHGEETTLELNYIDTEAPEVTAEITEVTSSTITVSAEATDTKTNGEKSGTSGVVSYKYSKDNGKNWTDAIPSTTYKFEKLTAGAEYTIKVKAIDRAGNEGDCIAKYTRPGETTPGTIVPTEEMPDLSSESSNITVSFNKSPNDAYVKTLRVSATISGNTAGYKVQSSVDNGQTWENYTSGYEKSFNKNGSLMIRLYDGTNAGNPVTEQITNVDNLGPEISFSENAVEEQTFTVKMTGNDKATSEYASSGVKGFYWTYKDEDGNYGAETFLEAKNNRNTLMLTELDGGKYTLKVYAVDRLNNKGEAKTISFEIEGSRIPNLDDGSGNNSLNANMTFIYDPDPNDGKTAGSVNVNVELSPEVERIADELNLTLYYITDTNSTWTELTSAGVDFSENGSLSVRLQEDDSGSSKTTGKAATATISHIDTLPPNANVSYKVPMYSANSILVQAFGTDASDGKSAVSGIRGMCFQYAVETSETASNESLSWSDWSGEQKATSTGSASYNILGLSQEETRYRIRVKLIDKVGRETVSTSTKSVTTIDSGNTSSGNDQNLPENVDNKIEYLYNGSKIPGIWTQDRVLVKLNFNINTDNYIARYRTDGIVNLDSNDGWINYDPKSSGFYVDKNCVIAAQIIAKDSGDMGDIYWGKIYWIDKEAPNNFSVSATPGVSTVTVKGKSDSDNGSDGYPGSGIGSYEVACFLPLDGQFITDSLVETMWSSSQLIEKKTITSFTADGYAEYKFTDLTPGVDHIFMMRAIDRVGNPSRTSYTVAAANDIPTLSSNDFTYKYLDKSGKEIPTGNWTNEDVKLVIDVTSEAGRGYLADGCKLVVNFDTTSVNYEDGGITISNGTQVYVGLKYGNVAPTATVKIEPARIDKTKPLPYELKADDISKSSKSLTITVPVDELVDAGSCEFDKDFMSEIDDKKFKYEVYYNNKLKGSSGDEPISSNTWTCTGLDTGTQYYVAVTYYDKAGNFIRTQLAQTSTAEMIETDRGNLDINVKPQTKGTRSVSNVWGNDGALVTITAAEGYTHYHIKYSYSEDKDPSEWDEYTGPLFVDENKTVYAQLQDDDNVGSGSVSARITCIETEPPSVINETLSAKTKPGREVTITATLTDSGGSGVYGYFLTTSSPRALTITTIGNRTWTPCTAGEVPITIPSEYTGDSGVTTLYLWVADYAGNISTTAKAITLNVAVTSDGSWDTTGQVNSPQLFGDMIPVKYDSNGNTIEVTDLSKWYDYSKGEWANAITVNEGQNMVTGYWVWIPRFAYRIDSGRFTSTAGKISVEFLRNKTDITSTGKTALRKLESTSGETQINYVVHPSFTANGSGKDQTYYNGEWSSELSGYWVAKFPAGKQAKTRLTSGNRLTENYGVTSTVKVTSTGKTYDVGGASVISSTITKISTDGSKEQIILPVFLPLTDAYNNIAIGDAYSVSLFMTDGSSNSMGMYGLDRDTTNSHMMKNSEWGAVVYLTQSVLGLNSSDPTKSKLYANGYGGHVTGVKSTGDTDYSYVDKVGYWAPWTYTYYRSRYIIYW